MTTTQTFRPVRWAFDDPATVYEGFTDGSTWNGFDNIWVTQAVRDQVVADLRASEFADEEAETADDIAEMEPDEHGRICLGWGYATQIVE